MNIIVPSLGRAGTAASMKWLQQSERRQIYMAVHADEAEAYVHAYPKASISVVPESCRHHIGKLRRYILDTHREPFFWVDDDIRLYLKTVKTVDQMFDMLEHHLEKGAAMAGIGQQLFSNMQNLEPVNGEMAVRNKFVSICYAIRPDRFDDCPLEELMIYDDVSLPIHAIRNGGTVVSYCATHSNLTPPKGGCNSWRTKEIIIADLNRIVALYPDICSIRPTTNTTHSQYIGIGLRTAWSKINK